MAIKEQLQDLHASLTLYFTQALAESMEEGAEPLPSATLSVIVSFLRNNDITADVKDDADLEELRLKLMEEKSGGASKNVVEVANKVAEVMQFDPTSIM